jgi:putative heme iron utilization protein
MNRHAGPPQGDRGPAVPEPSFPERARTLAAQGDTGTLATLSRKHPGHPFASVMPYALDERGCPLLLISAMAMHTHNLAGDPRASLLVTAPLAGGEPLAGGRVTLMGAGHTVPASDVAIARERYLDRHPSAASWVDFDDFAFWRLEVVDVYYVGGFGSMGWVDAAAYCAAEADPLMPVARGIIDHMNRDHADALVTYAKFYGGEDADAATMASVDRLGFTLRFRHGQRRGSVRVAFPREVRTAEDGRTVLIEMLRQARA